MMARDLGAPRGLLDQRLMLAGGCLLSAVATPGDEPHPRHGLLESSFGRASFRVLREHLGPPDARRATIRLSASATHAAYNMVHNGGIGIALATTLLVGSQERRPLMARVDVRAPTRRRG